MALATSTAVATPSFTGASFLAELRTKPIADRQDCVLAAALVERPLHWTRRYDKCLQVLERVPDIELGDPKESHVALSRGYAAHVFVKVLRIKGGVLLRATPSSHKFAYRELQALRMIAGGGPQNPMTGEELAGLVEAAGQYQKERTHR